MTLVKICGNTTKKDAAKCEELGADLIGTIVEVPVATPRKVSREKAAEILSGVSSAGRVMVIMPRSVDEALEMYDVVAPDYIQLHGNETLQFVRELRSLVPCNIIKTIHVSGEKSIKEAKKFAACCDALLLDTPSPQRGGSGATHDWEVSRKIVGAVNIPVILAGGLKFSNVKRAIETVCPYGVDASSGVEKTKGKKDYAKMKRFIRAAKAVNISAFGASHNLK